MRKNKSGISDLGYYAVHYTDISKQNTLFYLLRKVSEFTGIPVNNITSKSQKRELVDARFLFFRAAKERTRESLKEIGGIVGRDYADVIHGIKQTKDVAELKNLYENFKKI